MASKSGTVVNFKKDKGYGFIRPAHGGADIFVHFTGIAGDGFRELWEGELVEYDEAPGRGDKQQAVNVRVVSTTRR